MAEVLIEGMTPDEHRRVYPSRWRQKARNWSIFWWSLPIIPVAAVLNGVFGTAWDRADSSVCVGYIAAHFFMALDPARTGLVVNWYLDKPTAWERLRRRFAA